MLRGRLLCPQLPLKRPHHPAKPLLRATHSALNPISYCCIAANIKDITDSATLNFHLSKDPETSADQGRVTHVTVIRWKRLGVCASLKRYCIRSFRTQPGKPIPCKSSQHGMVSCELSDSILYRSAERFLQRQHRDRMPQ